MGCETLDRDYSIFDNYKQYVGETGVGYARLQSGWAKSEPEKGKYNFEWLDAQVVKRYKGKVIRRLDKDVKIAAFGAISPDTPYIRKGLAEIERLGGASEGRTKFTRLPLWDAPVLIINRDEIAWN